MINRKSIFSIYLLILTIFVSLFHGFLMVSASEFENVSSDGYNATMKVMSDGMNDEVGHIVEATENIKSSKTAEKSLMPCCLEDFSENKYQKFLGSRTSEVIKFLISNFSFTSNKFFDRQAIKPVLAYTNLSPPEKIILSSVIRLE